MSQGYPRAQGRRAENVEKEEEKNAQDLRSWGSQRGRIHGTIPYIYLKSHTACSHSLSLRVREPSERLFTHLAPLSLYVLF